ncbi:MAG TPA: glutamine-hydrolyzing carbamoyl-phosphate synthase small subunit [Planctomycetota bacterium]|nr:glutamine-hydrolyzing carbamoyl-phosphate synthase small subunit [Planctomycetota bacterium]
MVKMPHPVEPARVALEDGSIFQGRSFGAHATCFGEVVFNTSMSGYQEILTDPSYLGQIVTMTSPMIGNYGVNVEDEESKKIHLSGFIVKEASTCVSNYRSTMSLPAYLKKNKIPGVEGVDTRAITRRLRDTGSLRGCVTTDNSISDADLIAQIKAQPTMAGLDLVKKLSHEGVTHWTVGFLSALDRECRPKFEKGRFRCVALDCGLKTHIARCLVEVGADLYIVPAKTPYEKIKELKPDGLFLSNGPGDPEPLDYIHKLVGACLKTDMAVFGICLGHQVLCHALGGKTYKLKFGHHGANHPVKHLTSGKVEITSQNHGFAADIKSFGGDVVETHVNLNDQTNEGYQHKTRPVFAVQYHPEAAPGPHDSFYLFEQFAKMASGVTA